ncbi:hypothetical protein [Deinococcus multiflagellatus]|uniref:Branched-chain amino acid transport n=1 Tax=Deinococcus multiflagellatus TaxID=1656887 RepID=A0ABW1ZF94_9DEIO|nr:hypothetical protein [Deinococcus multiflagellatus]MBZ9712869.1 hypothetical protein [Deinococcus multiflagellatus]
MDSPLPLGPVGLYFIGCVLLAFRLLGFEKALPLSRRAAQALPGGLVLMPTLLLFMVWWRPGVPFWSVAGKAGLAASAALVLAGLVALGIHPVLPIALALVVWALSVRRG